MAIVDSPEEEPSNGKPKINFNGWHIAAFISALLSVLVYVSFAAYRMGLYFEDAKFIRDEVTTLKEQVYGFSGIIRDFQNKTEQTYYLEDRLRELEKMSPKIHNGTPNLNNSINSKELTILKAHIGYLQKKRPMQSFLLIP